MQDAIDLLHRSGYMVRRSRRHYAKGRPLPGLRPALSRLEVSDTELAERAGFSLVWVRTLKNDTSMRATSFCAETLAECLGVPVAELYGDSETRPDTP